MKAKEIMDKDGEGQLVLEFVTSCKHYEKGKCTLDDLTCTLHKSHAEKFCGNYEEDENNE